MLIKTEVKRRTEVINSYILSIKQKVYSKRYRQAIDLLRNSRDSINNSYMAAYDPNTFLFDSLKTKNQKLKRKKEAVQALLVERLENINKVKTKRGYSKQFQTYNIGQTEFVEKMCAQDVGAYASRLTLKLSDVERIDYETISLQTDFHVLKILFDDTVTYIPFRSIITIESEDVYMLICWRGDKYNNHSYMIMKFDHQDQRTIWSKCFSFARLICESQYKSKLFFKDDSYNIKIKSQKQENKQTYNKFFKDFNDKSTNHNKNFNLNIASNKSSAYDRLRRKSEYSSQGTTTGLINRSKSRKVSQDLSLKQTSGKNTSFFQRKMNNKSQKSLMEEIQLSNSAITKKQENIKKQNSKDQIKKMDTPSPRIQKIMEQRQKLQSEVKNNSSNNTQSNRQIFFNESSIHWIQEENDQQKSKASSRNSNSRNLLENKIMSLDIFSKEHPDQSQHISQVPAETEQSPLLPNHHKEKKRNEKKNEFEVEVKQVLKSNPHKDEPTANEKSFIQLKITKVKQSSQKSINSKDESSRNKKSNKAGRYSNNSMEEEEYEQDEDNEDNNESMNEDSENYDQSIQKQKQNRSKNLEIEDKSQDLISQNEQSQTQSRKYGLDDLKFGIMVLKCSPNGWKPHLKKLFLSNNDSQICWKNEKGDDLKKINIYDIEKIDYCTITPGISKHIKNIQKRRCMSIKCKKNNQYKMLQFYLPEERSIDTMEQFYEKLSTYVRYKNSHQL